LSELNDWLAGRCRALWDEIRHPEHSQFSVAEMLEHERPHLMPMPAPFDGYVEVLARVSSTCLITLHRNHYSVPCEWAGQMVSVRLYPQRLVIIVGDEPVASHDRLDERGQTRYDWQHYIPLLQRKPGALRNGAPFLDMPAPLQHLRRQLLTRDGGDRVMAQVLAAVPGSGLEAVLVAVELVVESGTVSVEHVLNMLGRLKPVPLIEEVETMLQIKEAPCADAQRYDRLRNLEDVQEVRHA
jgi:hypothetical protein